MNQTASVILSTERLTIRQLTDADAPALYAIFSHPEVMRYWSSPTWDLHRPGQAGIVPHAGRL